MKKISVYICLVLLAFLVTSCAEMLVTPVAYTRYETTGTQYAVYTANAVGDHILVYKNEAELDEWLPSADITFSFNECHGADTLDDGNRYTLVDVTHGAYLTVYITKASGVYSASKSIRLNGKVIVPDKTEEMESIWVLTFEEFPLVRTNPYGMIDPAAVNVIEYK